MTQADVLIVGAGIAGASAGWFAATSGHHVTLIDAGIETASQVPTALINPVRGYQGKLMPRGVEGACFTFALIENLVQRGYAIPFGRGLWRPCPDAEIRGLWKTNLATVPDVMHQWHDDIPAALQLHGAWAGAMFLPDSGWVDTAALLAALRSHSRIEIIKAEVTQIDGMQKRIALNDGRHINARELLWCGGAWGAARFGNDTGLRPGSLLVTDARLGEEAVSFGLYGAPYCPGLGSVIGPTTEPITGTYDYGPSPTAWVERTIERARAMFARPFAVRQQWHGVRLETTTLPPGLQHLTGFGSRGYLLAPLMAAEWAKSL